MTESRPASDAVAIEDEIELTLDKRIASMTDMLLSADPDVDVPAIVGALGEAFLERYHDNGDQAALTTGIAHLFNAAENAPEHVDHSRWCFWLGIGLGELARRQQSLSDYDRAIGWLSKLVDEPPEDDDDRDLVVVSAAELRWDRLDLLLYGADDDAIGARREADDLIVLLTSHPLSGRDAEAGYVAQLLLGLAYLTRHDMAGERSDLDNGIAALAEAVPHMPAGASQLALAWVQLTDAYLTCARLDDDRGVLDLAISTGDAASSAIDTDDSTWRLLLWHRAHAYKDRWNQRADPHDLDRSIGCWQERLADDLDPDDAAQCGDLLRARSELTNDPADILEAVRLLEFVVRTPADHDYAWQSWSNLGSAYQRQAGLLAMPESLDAAVRCLDRALEQDLPHDDVLFLLHSSRLSIVCDALLIAADHAGSPPLLAVTRARQLLTDATTVFERAGDVSAMYHSLLAGTLARTHVQLTGHDVVVSDSDEILRLVEFGRQWPEAGPEWLASMDIASSVVLYERSMLEIGTGEASITLLTDVLNRPGLDDSMRVVIRKFLPVLLQGRTSRGGDLRGQQNAIDMIGKAAGQPGSDADMELFGIVFRAMERAGQRRFDEFLALTRRA